jgi:hypothetical protein
LLAQGTECAFGKYVIDEAVSVYTFADRGYEEKVLFDFPAVHDDTTDLFF